jgi:raffinose/stachyose/melibiose transport system permease protein
MKKTLAQRIVINRSLYLLVLPTLVLISVFCYYPALSAVYRSFFQWDGAFRSEFVGFRNYIEAFGDRVLLVGAGNMLIVVVYSVAIELTFPLMSALLVFHLRSARGGYALRTLLTIPIVVPGIVVILVWRFIYSPTIGLLNQALTMLGREAWTQNWLGDPRFALLAVASIGFPWAGGFSFLIYLAGLQNISNDIFDACTVDGVQGWRRFRYIELPLIMGQVKLLVMLTLIGAVQGYQNYLILTEGGPGLASMMPGLHMYYSAFRYQKFGYGSAIGVLLFVVIFALTVVNRKFIQGGSER